MKLKVGDWFIPINIEAMNGNTNKAMIEAFVQRTPVQITRAYSSGNVTGKINGEGKTWAWNARCIKPIVKLEFESQEL